MSSRKACRNTVASDLGILVLRLGVGLSLALAHGWGKASRFVAGSDQFADPIGLGSQASLGLAAFGELIGGLLVVLGLFTRFGAGIAAFTMAVAAFVHHSGDPFGDRERAFVFFVGFLALALIGAGRWSFDHWWRRRRRK